MKFNEYADFAAMRADLLHDYEPQNAQERLLVNEVAASWRRLELYRDREFKFFDMQTHAQAIRDQVNPADYKKQEGAEVTMWLEHDHKALDQILRAIRDAGMAFDRAIRRIEQVKDRRLKNERQARKDQENRDREREKSIRQAHKAAKTATTQQQQSHNHVDSNNVVIEVPSVRRPDLSRAPDKTEQSA